LLSVIGFLSIFMTRKKYFGILLLVVGSLLLVLGLVMLWLFGPGLKFQEAAKEENEKEELITDMRSRLVLNLPAPGSIVGSPLLVRGRVYGSENEVELKLISMDGKIIEEVVTEVREEEINKQSVSLWQTSLVFDNYEPGQGWLEVRLIGIDGKIVQEERIPLVLR